jgi:hypothetical protein
VEVGIALALSLGVYHDVVKLEYVFDAVPDTHEENMVEFLSFKQVSGFYLLHEEPKTFPTA